MVLFSQDLAISGGRWTLSRHGEPSYEQESPAKKTVNVNARLRRKRPKTARNAYERVRNRAIIVHVHACFRNLYTCSHRVTGGPNRATDDAFPDVEILPVRSDESQFFTVTSWATTYRQIATPRFGDSDGEVVGRLLLCAKLVANLSCLLFYPSKRSKEAVMKLSGLSTVVVLTPLA